MSDTLCANYVILKTSLCKLQSERNCRFNRYNTDGHNCNTSNVCCLQNWKKRCERCTKV